MGDTTRHTTTQVRLRTTWGTHNNTHNTGKALGDKTPSALLAGINYIYALYVRMAEM